MNISEIMTTDPVVCASDCSIQEAARQMRDRHIGDVLVQDADGRPCGIVTDRDLVVRALAEDRDVSSWQLGEVCGDELHTISIDADVADIVALMQARSLRRVPVMEGDRLVGIVSLGDLASHLDGDSALGTISSAPPDR